MKAVRTLMVALVVLVCAHMAKAEVVTIDDFESGYYYHYVEPPVTASIPQTEVVPVLGGSRWTVIWNARTYNAPGVWEGMGRGMATIQDGQAVGWADWTTGANPVFLVSYENLGDLTREGLTPRLRFDLTTNTNGLTAFWTAERLIPGGGQGWGYEIPLLTPGQTGTYSCWLGPEVAYSVYRLTLHLSFRNPGLSEYALDNLRLDWYQPIPAPGAILLGTLGAGLVGLLRRRRVL